jgi:hypothetical protein
MKKRTAFRRPVATCEQGDDAAFYDAVARALRAFLAERLGRDGPNDVPRTVLDRDLPRHDVPPDLQDALYDVLDRCDEAQYAPRAGSAAPEDVLGQCPRRASATRHGPSAVGNHATAPVAPMPPSVAPPLSCAFLRPFSVDSD